MPKNLTICAHIYLVKFTHDNFLGLNSIKFYFFNLNCFYLIKSYKRTTFNSFQLQECDDLSSSLEPYQKENGQLLTHNNKLHMEVIQLNEKIDKLTKSMYYIFFNINCL